MGFFVWMRNLFIKKRPFFVAVPKLVTPEQIYEDIRKPSKSDSLVLVDDVREKIGQQSIVAVGGFGYFNDVDPDEWNICFRIHDSDIRMAGGITNRKPKLEISYPDFLRHELLPELIELIMKAPFLAMLADLDKTKDFKSWYQNFIDRISRERQEALALQKQNLTDSQHERVAGVLKRLELFEAELEKAAEYLRQYCRDSIAYIESMWSVIEGMVNEKRVALLEKNTHLLAQEATQVVREKYGVLQQHALAVNTSLKVFGMSEDVRLGELTPVVLEQLERGSAQLKSNLDEIHKVYFGNVIVEEEREKVTT